MRTLLTTIAATLLAVTALAQTTTSAPGELNVTLPVKGNVSPTSGLVISPQGDKALILIRADTADPLDDRNALLVVDMPSGKVTDVSKNIEGLGEKDRYVRIEGVSPDSTHALVMVVNMGGGEGSGPSLFVLGLADGKSSKIDVKDAIRAFWISDEQLGLLSGGGGENRRGEFGPFTVYSIKDGKKSAGKVAAVIGATGGGKYLAMINPRSLEKMRQQDEDAARMVLLDKDFKIQRELLPASQVRSQPLVSPNWKYVVLQSREESSSKPAKGPGAGTLIRVIDLEGKNSFTLDKAGLPLGVTDDGRVLALTGREDESLPLKLLSRDGKSIDIAEARAAGMTKDMIYYLTTEMGTISLKSTPLPKK